VKIKIKGFKTQWRIVKDIYAVGLPSIAMQSLGSVMLFGFNRILSGLSETAVAVLGAYFRLQSLIFMPVFGINQGVMPIFGYNFGAGNKKRLIQAFKYAVFFAFGIMTTGFILFQVFPRQLLLLFSASEQMLLIGVPALRIISICFPTLAVGIMAYTLFQAMGRGVLCFIGSLIRQLLVVLPTAWLLSRLPNGLFMVWAAFPIAEILGFIYALIMLRYVFVKDIKNLGERLPV
jgi:Na+-driven multidrug efflux pump